MFSYRSLIFFKTWIEFKRYLLRLYYVLSIVKKNSHLHNYNKLPLCWTVNSLCHHTRVISKQLVGTIFGKTLSFLNWESDTNPLFIRSGWKWPTLKYNAMEVFPLCYWLTTGQHNSYKEKLKVIKGIWTWNLNTQVWILTSQDANCETTYSLVTSGQFPPLLNEDDNYSGLSKC